MFNGDPDSVLDRIFDLSAERGRDVVIKIESVMQYEVTLSGEPDQCRSLAEELLEDPDYVWDLDGSDVQNADVTSKSSTFVTSVGVQPGRTSINYVIK